jgi:hypothetical protein
MKRSLAAVKDRLVKVYDYILELEKLPMRAFHGEDYEEKEKEAPRVRRQNKVKVEDLRPKKPADT